MRTTHTAHLYFIFIYLFNSIYLQQSNSEEEDDDESTSQILVFEIIFVSVLVLVHENITGINSRLTVRRSWGFVTVGRCSSCLSTVVVHQRTRSTAVYTTTAITTTGGSVVEWLERRTHDSRVCFPIMTLPGYIFLRWWPSLAGKLSWEL